VKRQCTSSAIHTVSPDGCSTSQHSIPPPFFPRRTEQIPHLPGVALHLRVRGQSFSTLILWPHSVYNSFETPPRTPSSSLIIAAQFPLPITRFTHSSSTSTRNSDGSSLVPSISPFYTAPDPPSISQRTLRYATLIHLENPHSIPLSYRPQLLAGRWQGLVSFLLSVVSFFSELGTRSARNLLTRLQNRF